jgi:DNA repair protein RadA/Sms
LLVEIQALVDPVQGAMPKRLSVGLDPQRLALLLAVLHRHGGIETGGYDVFVNAVGGVRINEPAGGLGDPARRLFILAKQTVAREKR